MCPPKPIPVSGQTARWYLSASYMARGGHVAKSGQLKVDKRDKPMKSSGVTCFPLFWLGAASCGVLGVMS